MKTVNPQVIQLKDYSVPDFLISTVDLYFDLHEEYAQVSSKLHIKRNPKSVVPQAPLILDGDKLELVSLKINGKAVSSSDYQVTEENLTIQRTPSGEFSLECVTKIKPQENLTLMGLYKSSGMFCTQCEAQGFRKITYYLDRPDVMAIFTTTLEADKTKYPVLLSNGNLMEKKDLGNGRHEAKWNDPFKKPAYLYALVAGDLAHVDDHFITKSGRKVKLEIYVNHGNEDRVAHAMESLKHSMKWDEDAFGLEYDLDIFMIVAVDDFNFGAMENKGLNLFNSSLVLAKPATATDSDYERIEGVVAHEYFHNWTGNRITCRDWFQLSLKEGLTVYRDQEFSADMLSRAVKRIDDVSQLRSFQFREDAGPMAHPIRPQSYIEINNFYTATVYEKGAEVIRMIATILGKNKFHQGIDKYFELFDGQAVTTDDFLHAMELSSGVDLKQFRETWYNQAGTPELKVSATYDTQAKTYTLEVKQSCAPSPGQPVKKTYHIPLSIALLDEEGNAIAEKVLQLKKETEKFVFDGVKSRPVPSLLRGFSAPVKLEFAYTKQELLFLLAKDSDAFSRWEAGQTLSLRLLQNMITQHASSKKMELDSEYSEVLGKIAEDNSIDAAFRARLLDIPDEGYIGEQQAVIQVDGVHAARAALVKDVALHNEKRFFALYEALNTSSAFKYNADEMGKRALKSTALLYLTATGNPDYTKLALQQLKKAHNMSDEIAALRALVDIDCAEREEALHHFYQKWNQESLVMNKWLSLQAISSASGALERVQRLMKDPVFNINNPNKVSSLLGSFARGNLVQFHSLNGAAYEFLADTILDIDARNPSLSARFVGLFNQWKRYDNKRQQLMRAQIERIVAKPGISPGAYEIGSKALL